MESHQFDNGSSPNGQEPEVQRNTAGATNSEEDIPACHSCRRRKLKCSREFPSCSHCLRLETTCSYNHKKNKPGIKAGAVESLNRRVEALENALLRQSDNDPDSNNGDREGRNGHGAASSVHDVLAALVQELRKSGTNSGPYSHHGHRSYIESPASSNGRAFSSVGDSHISPRTETQGRKRRRIDNTSSTHVDHHFYSEELYDLAAQLPPEPVMNAIVDSYFARIHPWIPMLHQSLFMSRLNDPQQRLGLTVILHAMVTAALKFVDDGVLSMIQGRIDNLAKKSRNTVILMAFDSLSVENLQALTIITFDDMGKGQASKAWSIVGSLTRTVEYLQLSVEMDDHEKQPVLKPLSSLTKTHSWTETEERRRVFWVIFLLDRFCSVTTGWNTSLTSDDVRRRLPCDGGLWAEEEPVITPYFGIWDKSAAKIGKSIAFIPAHYPSPNGHRRDNDLDSNHRSSPSASEFRPGSPVDLSTLGAFAYNIEATESLSQVTTFFLQQKVNFQDRQEVGSWLTRFKELDLRLVHWKMFLPQKWKDSNISREPAFINMDPNLTLAHITHNSSMILLHQRIAYPPPDWSEIVKLPSFCSAETCQLAAVETANIGLKYLKYTPPEGIASSQFIFCVFVSARVLLVHWRFYSSKLFPEFWVLVECLEDLSARWRCCQKRSRPPPRSPLDQAMKYALQLRELHERCSNDADFCLDVLGYSSEMSFVHERDNSHEVDNGYRNSAASENRGIPNDSLNNRYHDDAHVHQNESERQLAASNNLLPSAHIPPEFNSQTPSSLSSHQPTSHPRPHPISTTNYPGDNNALTPPPGSNDIILTPTNYPAQQAINPTTHMSYHNHHNHHHAIPPPSANSDDELSLISHTLMGQQFLEMDRVISFDDTTFGLNCMNGGGGGQNGQIGSAWAPPPPPPAGTQETGTVGGDYGPGT